MRADLAFSRAPKIGAVGLNAVLKEKAPHNRKGGLCGIGCGRFQGPCTTR